MIQDVILNPEFYIPLCKERYCNGILKIDIDLENFTINYECDNNKNHKGKNILFETFNKLYIKKRIINKCYKCSKILENERTYKCCQCHNIYCYDCIYCDRHIKNNMKNLIIKYGLCKSHYCKKIYYCLDCQKKLCFFCKEDACMLCKNHNVINILDIFPTENQIDSLKNILKVKNDYIRKLINSINKWENIFIRKINSLKKNLETEIIIFEKLFFNLNKNFLNYTYHSNFNEFINLIKIVNNKSLYQFYNSTIFNEQTKIITDICLSKQSNIEQKDVILKEIIENDKGKFININDNYFFYYSNLLNKVMIAYFNINDDEKESISYLKNTYITFNENIYSITPSIDNQRIYACLSNQKIVKIFNYDLEDRNMKLSDEEIKDIPNGQDDQFYKCIELSNNLIGTVDNTCITIWKKNNANKLYTKKFEKMFFEIPKDLLLVNNDYFITCFSESRIISFFDINNFNKLKDIQEIDSIGRDCLYLYKNYVIINCINGIAILSIKNKKLIRYIINFNEYNNKKLCIYNDFFYVLTNIYNISIMKFFFEEGYLIPIEEYQIIKIISNEENKDFDLEWIENLFYNNKNIIVFGKYIYLLKENEK